MRKLRGINEINMKKTIKINLGELNNPLLITGGVAFFIWFALFFTCHLT